MSSARSARVRRRIGEDARESMPFTSAFGSIGDQGSKGRRAASSEGSFRRAPEGRQPRPSPYTAATERRPSRAPDSCASSTSSGRPARRARGPSPLGACHVLLPRPTPRCSPRCSPAPRSSPPPQGALPSDEATASTEGDNRAAANTEEIVDVDHSRVKRQSIGNCWLYATASWAESLARGREGRRRDEHQASPTEHLALVRPNRERRRGHRGQHRRLVHDRGGDHQPLRRRQRGLVHRERVGRRDVAPPEVRPREDQRGLEERRAEDARSPP